MARHLSGRNPGRVLEHFWQHWPCLRQPCCVKKSERTAGRDGKTGRTASDGLSVADHEVYTSDQAGMTVRRAFQKISSDYLRNCPKEGRYAYEAVTTTCHEMDQWCGRTGSLPKVWRTVWTDEI